jgi:hypothetical protein
MSSWQFRRWRGMPLIQPQKRAKAAGKALGRCCLILAQFAFAEYSRSAETTGICTVCEGAGLTKSVEEVVKHPEYTKATARKLSP